MAKLTDKFFNRVIEGPLEVDSSDGNSIVSSLVGKDIKVKKLEATSDAKVGGKLQLTGNAEVGGKLQVTGNAEVFENIVDSNGNKRFIEGSLNTVELEGVTWTYNKWSLSGSHLMIVLAGRIANGTSLANNVKWADIAPSQIPTFIYDKIVAIANYTVCAVSHGLRNIGNYNQVLSSETIYMNKNNGLLLYRLGGTTALTAEAVFRIQIDLLIDNDSGE